MSLTVALEPLVPTAVQLLAESLRFGQACGRGRLAYFVRVLPLLNREARDLWRKERDAQLLLTFCDFLFSTGHRGRYLDGVLPSAANDSHNWTHPPSNALEVVPTRALEIEGVHQTRTLGAKKLDLEGRPDDADISARFALSIVKMHAAFRQHASYARHFGQCQRVGCVRPALLTPPEPERHDEEPPSAAEYWKCCRDGRSPPPTSSLPSDMSFCCYGCYKVTNSEFKKLVKFDIETPGSKPRHGGATTPSRLYRAAIQRNLAISRHIRSQKQVETEHYPSTMANREQLVREHTTMLSVDLGLLYAASLVHELPTRLRPKRPLPNTDDWREHASCHLGAICRVRAVYMAYGEGLLARSGQELWLRRLRDKVLEIF